MADHSYQLYVRRGPMPGEFFILTLPTIIIGRDPLSDILIRDPEVSRNHARLILTEHGYEIQDMGSTNGTFIEGSPLRGEPHALNPGELVTLGSNVVMEYQRLEMSNSDPLATMLTGNMNISPDRPLPQATGRLAEEDARENKAEDFSAFDLFNDAAAVNENDAVQDFAGDDDEDYFSSVPQSLPQTDYFGKNDEAFSRPSSAPASSRDHGRQSSNQASQPPEPAKKSNTLLTILAIVLIVLVALCCFFLAMTLYFLYDANLIGLVPQVLTTAV